MSNFRRALDIVANEQRNSEVRQAVPTAGSEFRSILKQKAAEQSSRIDELRAEADRVNSSTKHLEDAYMRAAEKRSARPQMWDEKTRASLEQLGRAAEREWKTTDAALAAMGTSRVELRQQQKAPWVNNLSDRDAARLQSELAAAANPNAAAHDVANLTRKYDEVSAKLSNISTSLPDAERTRQAQALGDKASAYEQQIKNRQNGAALAQRYLREFERNAYEHDIMNAPDFAEMSAKGAAIENPEYDAAQGKAYIFGWRPGSEQVGNIVTFSRTNAEDLEYGLAHGDKTVGDPRYQYMTDKEVGVYNYLLAARGKDEAEKYLKRLDETLSERAGRRLAESVLNEENDFLRGVGSVTLGITSGFENAASGIKQTFTKEAITPTAGQYAAGYVRSELDGGTAFLFDLAQSAANMTPSILLSSVTAGIGGAVGMSAGAAGTLGQVMGAVEMGLQSRGNAISEKLREGYTYEQASMYGTLVGASEAGLQYLLGGISKLGGKLTGGKVAAKIAAIDNTLGRVALKLGSSMASEGLEEGLQEILEPIFAALILDEEYEPAKWNEVAYAALLGAVSAGLFEGVSTFGEDSAHRSTGKEIAALGSDTVQSVIDVGLKSDRNSMAYKVAQELQSRQAAGKTITPHALGEVYAEVIGTSGAELDAVFEAARKNQEAARISEAETEAAADPGVGEDVVVEPDVPAQDISVEPAVAAGVETNSTVERGLANEQQQTEGERVLPGSGERHDGASSGEQTGRMAERAGRSKTRSVQAVAAANRQSAVAARGLGRISTRDAGIARGTTEAWMTVIPDDLVAADSELSAIYEKNRADGYETRFFIGRAEFEGGTGIEGWLNASTREIWIQADSRRDESTATKLNEHERGHIELSRPDVKRGVAAQVINKYGKEQIDRMIAAYDEAYHTLDEPQSFSEAIESQWLGYSLHEMDVIEEILADAYSGRNRFGVSAGEMQANVTSAISDYAETSAPSKTNAAATARRTAPPPNAVAYSIEYDASGTPYVVIDEDILAGVPRSEWVRTVKNNMREKFPNGVVVGNNEIAIDKQSRNEITYSRYMQQLMKSDPAMFADKLRATNNADEIIRASRNYVNESLMHPRKDNIEQFARGEVQMRVGANDYAAQVVVAMRSNGKLLLYDIIDLTPTEISAQNKKSNAAKSVNPSPGVGRSTASGFSIPSISESGEDVNTKFSLSAPMEEAGDLIAMHNLEESELLESLALGGLPMPSIAIVKAKAGHSKYGPISLIFDKRTIDPQADRRNKVYGADAWTPTFPKTEWEVNSEVVSRVEGELYRLAETVADGVFAGSGAIRKLGIDDSSAMSVSEIAERLADDDTVRAAYLAERGLRIEPKYEVKQWNTYFDNEVLQTFIDKIGAQKLEALIRERESGGSLDRMVSKTKRYLRESLIEKRQSAPFGRPLTEKERRRRNADYADSALRSANRIEDAVKAAWMMYTDGGKTKGEVDRLTTREYLRRLTSHDEVATWIEDKMDGLLGEQGIQNGVDPYTEDGDYRSFAETHDAYTLENIVKAMDKQQKERGEGMVGVTATALQATAARKYSSIDEIRADRRRLRHVERDEYHNRVNEVNARLQKIMVKILTANEMGTDSYSSDYTGLGDALIHTAMESKSIESIIRSLGREGYRVDSTTAEEISRLYGEAASLPTEYFEAKPHRAVGMDEVIAAVIPSDSSEELRNGLEGAGVRTVDYAAGDNADRLRAVNSVEGVRFSLSAPDKEDPRLDTYGMPEKEKIYRVEKEFADKVLNGFGLDRKTADNPELMEAIRDLTVEIANTGTLSEAGIETAFEVAFDRTLVDDPEHEGNSELLRYLRRQPIQIADEDKSDIPGVDSFKEFSRKAFGVMRLSDKRGIPVDMLYDELTESYPQYFVKDITHPAEQLAKIYEVAKELQPKQKRFGELYDFNRDAAYEDFRYAVGEFEKTLSEIPQLPSNRTSPEERQATTAASGAGISRPFAEEVARQLQNTVEGRSNTAPVATKPEINPDLARVLTKEEYAQVEKYVQERRAERKEPTDFEAMKRDAADAKAERLRVKSRDEFSSTPAIDKLGIKIANSAGIYDNVDVLQENARAARSLRRELRRAELRLHTTDAEKDFASKIASGLYDEADIPRSLNANKVMTLVDYYWAEQSFGVDFIAERRRMVKNVLDEQASELLRDADANGDGKMSGMRVLNNRTPERNMLHIFGDECGAEINRWLFEPVAQNEAERYRFLNRMMDEVREFEGADGRTKRLSKEESALVHQYIEGKAVGEMVAGMEMRASIEAVAENINNGDDAAGAAVEFGLTAEQRTLAEKYARWLKTQQTIENGKVDSVRIKNAAKKYSAQFDMFYAAINDFLVAHGYEPIGFIKGYAPHIQPEENQNLLNKALQSMGLSTDPGRLPTSIAGLTAEFKPNKRWNPFFLTRNGDITEYDIVTAYESYVDYLSDVLYHTDDIMRTRQAVNYLRRTYAPEDIHDLVEQAYAMKEAPVEAQSSFLRAHDQLDSTSQPTKKEIQEKIEEYTDSLLGDAKNMSKYSNLVMYLDNYANILAGKQSYADRGSEYRGGRKGLAWANKAMRIFARAQVAGNLSSALNQTAQLPQIVAENGVRHTLEALKDMGAGRIGGNRNAKYKQWMLESDFLVGKAGIDYIARTPGEMVTGALFKPAEVMDGFTSQLAVRGRYLKEIAAGRTHSEAMHAADAFGNAVMGSRMKGSKPLAYHSKEVLSQIVHMFQVEAVNSWEHLSQDLPRDFRRIAKTQGKSKAALALGGVIVKMLLAAFALNRLDEELYGGTPAPYDLIGLTANFIASGEGLTTNEGIRTLIDNVWEKAFGERVFGTDKTDEDREFDLGAAAEDTIYNITNDIPFLRNAAGLLGLGDNTLPLPDVKSAAKNIWNAATSAGVASPDMGMAVIGAASELLPGGRQLKKTAQGIETAARGGRYKGYGENAKLQYPVSPDFWSVVRAMMFGNNGLPETSKYYAGDDRALSAKQTQLYEELVASGMDRETAYNVFQHYKDMNAKDYDTNAANKATEFSCWVDAQGYTDEQVKLIKDGLRFYQTIPVEAGRYEKMSGEGLSKDDAYDLTNALAELEPEEGRDTVSDMQKLRLIASFGLSEKDMVAAMGTILGTEATTASSGRSHYALLKVALLGGWTVDEYLDAKEAGLMNDSSYARMEIGRDYGISVNQYIYCREAITEDNEDGSVTQAEAEDTIRELLGLTNKQRAVLWQMQNKSWSAAKNPFDSDVGERVKQSLE